MLRRQFLLNGRDKAFYIARTLQARQRLQAGACRFVLRLTGACPRPLPLQAVILGLIIARCVLHVCVAWLDTIDQAAC